MVNEDTFILNAHITLESEGADGQLVVVDGRTGSMWIANESSKPLLTQLRRGASEKELMEELVSAYNADDRIASRDVRQFLGALTAAGVLEISSADVSVNASAVQARRQAIRME